MGMAAIMAEEHGEGVHVDMGCVHHNVEALIADHGTNGELNLDQFLEVFHEAEEHGPCYHEA